MKFPVLALAALLAVGTATASYAETLGQLVDSGKMSERALTQLIGNTGLTPAEARELTREQVVAIRWQND